MSKELYYWYKEQGRCPKCGGDPVRGKVFCINCLDRAAESERKKREKWTEEKRKMHNEQQREYHKKVREERKAKGICIECGKRPSGETQRCALCRYKINKKKREKHFAKGGMTYEERIERGRCYFCGAPALEGKRTCAKCYEREKIIAQNMRNHIKLSGFKKTRELFW
jgi:hypothetical protein